MNRVVTLLSLVLLACTNQIGWGFDYGDRPPELGLAKLSGTDQVEIRGFAGTRHQEQKTTAFKKNEKGEKDWKLIDTKIPLRLGKPLPLIPFVFHGPRHSRPTVEKLPLADIIAVNLDHYRLDADYKHGMHFTALPTAWVSGFDKTASLRIGSSTAWVSEAFGATAQVDLRRGARRSH